MNLFTIAPQDQSVYYLGVIFGNVANLVVGPNATPGLLGVMFQTFNTMVLTIGAFIVVYVTVMGVMVTAHEGEFMGKKFQSLWTPIRMVIGIAGLVPISGGYCAIQIVIMWIILQGVGAADTLWGTVLKYMQMQASTQAATVPSMGVQQNLQTLFQSLVCQQSARWPFVVSSPAGTGTSGTYWCASHANDSFCQSSLSQSDMLNAKDGPKVSSDRTTYSMGPPGVSGAACGTLQSCNQTTVCAGSQSTSLACLVCKAQKAQLAGIVPLLGEIARVLVVNDVMYRQFYYNNSLPSQAPAFVKKYCEANGYSTADSVATGSTTPMCCNPQVCLSSTDCSNVVPTKCPTNGALTLPMVASSGGNDDYNNTSSEVMDKVYWPYLLSPIASVSGGNFTQVLTQQYVSAISDVVLNYIQNSNLTDSTQQFKTVYNQGWIFAGVYYYSIAQINNSNADSANTPFTVQGNDPNQGGALNGYMNNYSATGALITYINGQGTTSTPVVQLNAMSSLSTQGVNTVSTAFMGMITGGGPGQLVLNPLSNLQTFGKILLIIVQVIFFVYLAIVIVLMIVGEVSAILVLGTGLANGLASFFQTLFMVINPLLGVVLGALFTLGATLAIYAPLIPYVVFTVGAIGWFIQAIEAIVAGPLIALGIMSPSGQHEIMGKAEQAIMLLFNLFLRPSLMIFGLMAAMLMASAVVTMINAGFGVVIAAIYANPGLVEILLFIGAYVSLIMTALNKCFSLVWILPDRILTWMGGQAVSYGDAAEALSGVKGAVEGGAGTMAKAGSGAGSGVEARTAKKTADRKAAAKAAAKLTPGST